MNSPRTDKLSNPEVIDDLLDIWEEAKENGETISIDELCREHPELHAEVAKKIAALENMERRFQPDAADTLSSSSVGETDKLNVQSELTRLTFHAKGGLGAVYRATEVELNRDVAVKFIHHNLADDPDSRQRFALEAEVTGRLEHPGVVPLYGIGRAASGRLFYYMRYIDGETMDAAINRFHQTSSPRARFADHSVAFRRLIAAFTSVCKTIAYAHNRGIVHRDIKPSNVMLGKYGETIVVDWGLAISVVRDEAFKVPGEATLCPATGSNSGTSSAGGVGTPAYMSPEQALDLHPTPASDIYSLGATLYKLLTGTPAFTGENANDIKRRVIEGAFVPPLQRISSVPKALDAICRKAMSKQPVDRYGTALDLANDLENYMADAPVSVYSESLGQQIGRWSRRHRLAAQAALTGLAAILIISTLSAFWMGQLAKTADQERDRADQMRVDAQAARLENLRTSARFLARSLAYEIDLRWRMLEAESAMIPMQQLLASVNEDPTDANRRAALQAWLMERKLAKAESVKSAPWCVYSQDGTQVARAPMQISISVGKSFAHRDYFHGLGRDLPLNDPQLATIAPFQFLRERASDSELVHMSAVFEGVNTHTLMVSFSVPVWSPETSSGEPTIIGIMSVPVEINMFDLPLNAMVFQSHADQLTRLPGLILAHPRLKVRSSQDLPPRVSGEIVETATQLAYERLRQDASAVHTDSVISDFVDPVTDKPSLAAIEPVLVRNRPSYVMETGWFVVVHEMGK
ncbi:MAG: serine/threonine-protein kinase [Pirellulaceae bacterium]|nr:serine/threonine protein kinase [Planctomycetales bacterium]